MNANVGTIDRVARVALGLLLIALAATETTGAWAYIGIIPLATGVLRFCPAYRIFGFSSCAS